MADWRNLAPCYPQCARECPAAAAARDVEKGALREMIASLQEENRALRRELAARRAVDGWLLGDCTRRVWIDQDGRLCARGDDSGGWWSVPGIDYPALAAALGLEVEDE